MSTSNNIADRPNGPESGPAGPHPESPEHNPNNNNTGHDQTHGHHSSPPPQPVMGYPPVIGYPPGTAHPPPEQYPPNYNPYPYPPAAVYYPSPNHPVYMHPVQGAVPRPTPVEGFIRGVITAMLILIIVSCLVSIISVLLFRPMLPEYHLTSFSVTNFQVTDGMLTGNWDATLLVHNPNPNQKVSFDRTKAYVYYGNTNMADYLSSAVVQPMSLGMNATSSIQVRNTMANQVQPPDWIVEAIGEERGGGEVKLEVALPMLATFKSEMGWTTHLSMMAYCDHLTVRFPNATAASGSVASSDLPRKCIILS